MISFYLFFYSAVFIFSILINSLFLKFSKTLGIRNKSETIIRWATTSKPAFGGISFFFGFLISVASYSIFFSNQEVLRNPKVAALLGTATIAFLMGLADDAYNTKPLLKALIQILCGVFLCYSGTYINIFTNTFLNYAVTVFWVIGMMNSINMLDNMDAIATVVSISIFSITLMLIYLSGSGYNNIHFLILAGIIASLFGFLIFNWNPSKLFMGDTGSQLLGLLLAAMGIIYFWNDPLSSGNNSPVSRRLLLVAIGYILPLTDTTIVFINRILQKKSPFIGGCDHTTHHLFFRGIREKYIAIIFAFIGIISTLLIFIIKNYISEWNTNYFLIFALFPIVIFTSFFILTRINSIFTTRQQEQKKNGTSINISLGNVEEHLTKT